MIIDRGFHSDLNLHFVNRLDVSWDSPSLPVSSLESCSSATVLLLGNSPISCAARIIIVITIVITLIYSVTQNQSAMKLQLVQGWVLAN